MSGLSLSAVGQWNSAVYGRFEKRTEGKRIMQQHGQEQQLLPYFLS